MYVFGNVSDRRSEGVVVKLMEQHIMVELG
jgi:hypothetical protein